MVWSIRNVVYSGILRELAQSGWRVHLLIPEVNAEVLRASELADFELATSVLPLQEARKKRRMSLHEVLSQVVRSAFHQRNGIRSFPIYRRWLSRKSSGRMLRREKIIDLLGNLARPTFIFIWLVWLNEVIYRWLVDLEPVRQQLRALNPDLVWSTVCVRHQEYPYVLVCHDMNICIVTSILSFDNLTSRTTIPKFDHYLVWNQRMHDQLLSYYHTIRAQDVSITGTPQFDFHRSPGFQWSREDTLSHLGLPEGSRYILYTGSSQFLAPDEPELVSQFARRLATDPMLSDSWLVVRLHPLDDWDRWRISMDASYRVILSLPWASKPDKTGWTLSSPNDQRAWISSLLHADCCINIASTTSLDAAILDRPVIGIRFDKEPQAPPDILYEEYDTEHYIHLAQSDGIQLALSWENLMNLIHEARNNPSRWRAARELMVAREVGQADGQAAKRVLGVLNQLVTKLPNRVNKTRL